MSRQHETNGEEDSHIRAEWKHLFRNKILLLSLTVIMFIPIMYGGFFLGSIWNPYGRTQNMPVAFVNDDKGAVLQGQSINVGNTVAKTLKDNHDLRWEFVDDAVAQQGVKDGHYYAVVRIPNTFSSNVASMTSASPQKAVIDYTITPAKNYIGSLISTQAANKIKTEVSEQIIQAYAKGIFDNLGLLGAGLNQAAEGATQLSTGSSTLATGIKQYTGGVQQLATNQQSLSNGLMQLETGSRQLRAGLQQTGSALPTDAQIAQLTNGVDTLQSGIGALYNSVSNPSPEMTTAQKAVAQDAENLKVALGTLASDSTAMQTILTNASTQVAQGGSATLSAADVQMIARFATHSQAVAQQSITLLTNLQTMTTLLQKQQSQLASGVGQLQTGVTALAPATNQALRGYTTLRNANNQLVAGSNQLASGLEGALSGSQQLASGASLLDSKSQQLTQGATQLTSGTTTLANALLDASKQVQIQPTGEKTQAQLAAPVTAHEQTNGDVPNYGYALAPYVLSLGLFVGALVVNVIYPVRKIFSRHRHALSWWAAKLSVVGAAAIVQATILMIIMVWFLGLHPMHPVQFTVAIYLTSLANMMIVTFLVIMLDNPGRFLAMLLLVLQLGASEGTFPLQTSPKFFQLINPFLPMTYSIRALREAISGGLGVAVYARSMVVLVLFMIVAMVALLLFLIHRGRRSFAHTSVDGDN